MRREQLEDGETHEAGRHGHDGHPSCLEAEIDVGGTDDSADCQACHDAPNREAASWRCWRRHGRKRVGDLSRNLVEQQGSRHDSELNIPSALIRENN